MGRFLTARVGALVLGACVALPVPGLAAKRYVADRFDVVIRMMPDGSLRISETVIFRFEGGPFTYVYRDLPASRTDGISIERITMDGREAAAAAEVARDRSHVRVTVRFRPPSDTTATFGLEYVAHRAIEPLSGDEALLSWRVLPTRHDYRIASSRIALEIPPDFRFSGAPELRPRHGAGIIESAPQGVEPNRESSLELQAANLGKDASLLLRQRLTSHTAHVLMPAWLERDERARREAPFWLMMGALLGVVELTGLILLWRGRRSALDLPVYPSPVPPDQIPPALAGALVADGAAPSRLHAIATLFSLAQRGAVSIDERPRSWWLAPRRFVARMMSQPPDLRPHERVVLELVRTSGEQGLSKLLARLQRRFGEFRSALEQELRDAGWIDARRRRQKPVFAAVSTGLLVLAGASFVVVLQFLPTDGPALLAIPLASAIVAVAGLVMGANYSPLSDAGLQRSALWKGFRVSLQDISKGRTAASARDVFEPFFPYATAFGLAQAWTKHFGKEEPDLEMPAWFHAARFDDGSVAFAAMVSSSGGSSGAAAGGGAAGGGGASGAG
ncbi:MAG: DUF2207 domain-containing protein [Acidobacteria bacterium]|nr:DUF2207 domain-containing protein [Acidobacteriota bacterium]